MTLMQPSIDACIDGNAHSWLIVSELGDAEGGQWQNWWCQKCGVVTQVQLDESGGPLIVMNQDNTPYFLVPKLLKITIPAP